MTRALACILSMIAILVAMAPSVAAQTACIPPSITTEPVDQAVAAGQTATLTAAATGTGIRYQWFRNFEGNWISISGATSPSVTVRPAATTEYKLFVTGTCGTAVSRTATVTVCTLPVITSHPASVATGVGSKVTLSVEATGTDLQYQWYNGTSGDTNNIITGARTSTITITATSTRSLWVRVSNQCGHVNSKTARITVITGCVPPSISSQPTGTTVVSGQTATLSVTASGSTPSYQWYMGERGNTAAPIAGATTATLTTPPLTQTTSFWVRISNECGAVESATATVTVAGGCSAPSIVTQPQNATVTPGASTTLRVVATGTAPLTYQWYSGMSDNASAPLAGATSSTFTTAPITATASFWVRVANACGQTDSATATVSLACAPLPAPDAKAPAQVLSGTTYTVAWNAVAGATGYEIEESENEVFAGAVPTPVAGNSASFTHTVAAPSRFHYRVRATGSCAGDAPFSVPERVAVVPPPDADDLEQHATAPEGSVQPIVFEYRLMPPAAAKSALDTTFTTTTDKPWLTASPASGTIPPGGTTVTVAASPSQLPTGTNTGTLVITSSSGTTLANVPLSVTIVTPVTTVPKEGTDSDALIVPVVGHAAGGASSLFLSDIRIANVASEPVAVRLFYTPSRTSGADSGKESTIVLQPLETKAINDVARSWFGFGSTGESALGVLELRPVQAGSGGTVPATEPPIVVSSRTYNLTPDGTYGQFIPAVPYANFVGKADGSKISLQQIAQTAAYRTNFGIVEGAGQHATAAVRIINAGGQKLTETTITLMPWEHQQWNRFLETLGIANLADGRIEVEVTSDTGRVTAYASVVDNVTNDPLLVFPTVPSTILARRFVLPGVADLNTGSASWRSDVRVFNAGATAVTAVLSFQESRRADGTLPTPLTRGITLQPGRVTSFDNILQSQFGITDVGGLVHINAPTAASLVVTGRTYDQKIAGTYGQFIPAVTYVESAGLGDRPLQILQVEQSGRYRTNLGLAETSGSPAMVEIYAIVPDAPVAVRKEVYLAANEFVQLNRILEQMQIPTAYNARLTARVIAGDGTITAYASVVDNQTQDPTYVPAQ